MWLRYKNDSTGKTRSSVDLASRDDISDGAISYVSSVRSDTSSFSSSDQISRRLRHSSATLPGACVISIEISSSPPPAFLPDFLLCCKRTSLIWLNMLRFP
ncbi:hypothetical protein NE237_023570 [Protea cynaroides]|uniref:Uncharacterized protein n=1 Tax=Protea cynaroides TaxID=273540 RepID=A0A9Q0K5A2_9MAGN|nr:hypothetical protein NE237_023570 [Protea cynaroides]